MTQKTINWSLYYEYVISCYLIDKRSMYVDSGPTVSVPKLEKHVGANQN